MAEQSKNEVKFNSNLGGMLTIISPFHSELDIKPEMDPSMDSDDQQFADFKGTYYLSYNKSLSFDSLFFSLFVLSLYLSLFLCLSLSISLSLFLSLSFFLPPPTLSLSFSQFILTLLLKEKISGSELQVVTESYDTTLIKIPFDAIKTELPKIEPFEDPFEVDEKGR